MTTYKLLLPDHGIRIETTIGTPHAHSASAHAHSVSAETRAFYEGREIGSTVPGMYLYYCDACIVAREYLKITGFEGIDWGTFPLDCTCEPVTDEEDENHS